MTLPDALAFAERRDVHPAKELPVDEEAVDALLRDP
jgi:hypothetical protein